MTNIYDISLTIMAQQLLLMVLMINIDLKYFLTTHVNSTMLLLIAHR